MRRKRAPKRLEIRYTGPFVDAGEVVPDELAPALRGALQLVRAIANILYGEETAVQVEGRIHAVAGVVAVDFSLFREGERLSDTDEQQIIDTLAGGLPMFLPESGSAPADDTEDR